MWVIVQLKSTTLIIITDVRGRSASAAAPGYGYHYYGLLCAPTGRLGGRAGSTWRPSVRPAVATRRHWLTTKATVSLPTLTTTTEDTDWLVMATEFGPGFGPKVRRRLQGVTWSRRASRHDRSTLLVANGLSDDDDEHYEDR